MSRFQIHSTSLADLKVIERQHVGDCRGHLSRIFCAEELSTAGWRGPIAQINHTMTMKCGTVRGMHYQRPPHTEYKLVSCLRGEVWDVAVDLRAGSATFLRWHGELLSSSNQRALLIPAGFAHGFQTQSDVAELLYCHSAFYAPTAEDGLNPVDPRLAICWPLQIAEMSSRDEGQPYLNSCFGGLSL